MNELLRVQVAVLTAFTALRERAEADKERGEVTSTMLLIATFCLIAVAVGAIVIAKTMASANAIPDAPAAP